MSHVCPVPCSKTKHFYSKPLFVCPLRFWCHPNNTSSSCICETRFTANCRPNPKQNRIEKNGAQSILSTRSFIMTISITVNLILRTNRRKIDAIFTFIGTSTDKCPFVQSLFWHSIEIFFFSQFYCDVI